MTSPTACGALFSARTTSQNLVEPWWNVGGTLVEPSWNLTSGPPRTTPEPISAETSKLSAAGVKNTACAGNSSQFMRLGTFFQPNGSHLRGFQKLNLKLLRGPTHGKCSLTWIGQQGPKLFFTTKTLGCFPC